MSVCLRPTCFVSFQYHRKGAPLFGELQVTSKSKAITKNNNQKIKDASSSFDAKLLVFASALSMVELSGMLFPSFFWTWWFPGYCNLMANDP